MNALIKEISTEAHEILSNIRNAAINGEITWAQRDELVKLVNQDVSAKLTMARNLLYGWTGNYGPADGRPE